MDLPALLPSRWGCAPAVTAVTVATVAAAQD
jgi:hypothetical protein